MLYPGDGKTGTFGGNNRTGYNVTGSQSAGNCLWSLGCGSVSGSANCFVYVDCQSKKVKWHCSIKYQGRDSFDQPLNIDRWAIHVPGNFGGTPYAINIGWSDFISGGN